MNTKEIEEFKALVAAVKQIKDRPPISSTHQWILGVITLVVTISSLMLGFIWSEFALVREKVNIHNTAIKSNLDRSERNEKDIRLHLPVQR